MLCSVYEMDSSDRELLDKVEAFIKYKLPTHVLGTPSKADADFQWTKSEMRWGEKEFPVSR